MSTDIPKAVAGNESDAPAAAPPTQAQPLSELQRAIQARARETIARREAKPPKSRTQLLVALGVALALAFIAFFGINYLVAGAQRMIAEFAESRKEPPVQPPAPQANGEPGVVILQPDRTLDEPKAPVTPPPAETPVGK